MALTLLAYACLILSAFTHDLNAFTVDYWKTQSIKTLAKDHPQFTRLKQIYLVLYAVFFIGLALATVYFVLAAKRLGSLSFLLIVPFINTFKLLDGAVGLGAGLYFTGYRGIKRYYYDKDRRIVWVSYVQIGLAVLLSLSSLILYFWK